MYNVSENNENQILIVDDSRVIRRAAVKILQKDFAVVEAEDGEEALDILRSNPKISVVFSDIGMPNMDGFELLEQIRASDDEALARMPVVIITGAEETDGSKEKVLSLGATDFITKPFDSVSLKSRAGTHINYRNEVQSLEKRVSTDKLTGLLVDSSFKQQGEQAVAYAARHCTQLSLVSFSIDQFSELFMKHGRSVAEQILHKVASIINEGKRKEDIAARMGVSQFALLLPSSDPQGAEAVVARICDKVGRLKLRMGEEEFKIRFSSGITSPRSCDDQMTFAELQQQAEGAMQTAVEIGRAEIICYQTGHAIDPTAPSQAGVEVDVNLEELLQQLSQQASAVTDQQLASAMRKILPLVVNADGRLKLGLSKVILHLKKRLFH
jgi:diguanylate cyclase (GGDEF)-like protein